MCQGILTTSFVEEQWQPLLELENYFVSSFGRVVRRQKNKKDVWININHTEDENFKFIAHGKKYYVHRLVATYFNSAGKGDMVIHLNRDHRDNKVDNLLRCAVSEANKKWQVSRRITGNAPLLQFSLNGQFIKRWKNADEVEEQLGFRRGDILCCCEGDIYTAFSFIWCFDKMDGIFAKFPILKDRLEKIKPYIISIHNLKTSEHYACVTIAEGCRLTGLSEKEFFTRCLITDFDDEWRIEYNGTKYRMEDIRWLN